MATNAAGKMSREIKNEFHCFNHNGWVGAQSVETGPVNAVKSLKGKKRGRAKRPRARVVGSYGSLSKANDSTGFDLIAIIRNAR